MKKLLFLLFLLPSLAVAQKLPDSIRVVPMVLKLEFIKEIDQNRERLKALEPYVNEARQLQTRQLDIIRDNLMIQRPVDPALVVDWLLPVGTDTVKLYVKKPKVKKP